MVMQYMDLLLGDLMELEELAPFILYKNVGYNVDKILKKNKKLQKAIKDGKVEKIFNREWLEANHDE